MVHLEIVAVADPAQHRPKDRLVDIVDTLAAGTDQVVVVLGDARHIRRNVTSPLEARRHPGFHLRLEGAVHGRETEARMAAVKALVELLRRHGLPLGGERLRDDDALLGETPAA